MNLKSYQLPVGGAATKRQKCGYVKGTWNKYQFANWFLCRESPLTCSQGATSVFHLLLSANSAPGAVFNPWETLKCKFNLNIVGHRWLAIAQHHSFFGLVGACWVCVAFLSFRACGVCSLDIIGDLREKPSN